VAEKAKRMPVDEPKFRNLYCNQRVSPTSTLISRTEWAACAGDAVIEKGSEIYLALDLSAVVDLCALVAVSAGPTSKIMPYIFKPEDLLEEHSRRDFGKGENRYQAWADNGTILTSPGKSINPLVVAKKVIELCGDYRVLGLAYDRWRINDLQREFDELQFETYIDKTNSDDKEPKKTMPGLRMVPWGQGYRDMAPAIDALEIEITERTLIHPSNHALTWTVGNAIAHTDPAGNRKLDKEKARFRIDPAVAMTMGIGLKSRDRKKVDRQFQVLVY
jgi:phage terminase large subunit-like protein